MDAFTQAVTAAAIKGERGNEDRRRLSLGWKKACHYAAFTGKENMVAEKAAIH